MLEDNFLPEVLDKGRYFREQLAELAVAFPKILSSSRGMGLIVAGVLTEEGVTQGAAIVNAMFDRGYLMNFAGNAVLRFVPPLIVTKAEIDEIIGALRGVLAGIEV